MSAPKRRLIVAPEARTERLRSYPYLGRARDDLAPGLRVFPVEAHVLYYEVGEREVIIVRILHGHMDASAHLSP